MNSFVEGSKYQFTIKMLIIGIFSFLYAAPLQAADATWEADINTPSSQLLWSIDANWNPSGVPSSGSDLKFIKTDLISGQSTDDLSGFSVNSMSFDVSGSRGWYIYGSTPLTIGGGGITKSGNGETDINPDLVLSSPQSWTVNGGTLFIAGDVALGNNTLTANVSGSGVFNKAYINGIVSGSGGITKTGSANLVLSGDNTYTGNTLVQAGLLSVGNNNALGSIAGGTTVSSGATLEINNVKIGNESLTIGGYGNDSLGALKGTGTASLDGNVTLSSTSRLGGTGTLTLNGSITGSSGIEKVDTGTVVLTGANTYTGDTIVNEGTLRINNPSAFGSAASKTIVNAGGTLQLDYGLTVGSSRHIILNAGLTEQAELNAIGASTINGQLTVNAGPYSSVYNTIRTNGDLTINSNVDGTGGFHKKGYGTLILNGQNTYSGPTYVDDGKLVVNGKVTGDVGILNSYASLGGAGTIQGNVSNAGKITPGNSPGVLTINGNLSSSGDLIFELGGTTIGSFDALAINGNASFTGGKISFDFINGFTPQAGDYWTFFSADSITGWGNLTFEFLDDLNPDLSWQLSVLRWGVPGSGDVTYFETLTIVENSNTSVPEPASAFLLGLGLAGIAGLARSRKKMIQ